MCKINSESDKHLCLRLRLGLGLILLSGILLSVSVGLCFQSKYWLFPASIACIIDGVVLLVNYKRLDVYDKKEKWFDKQRTK